MCIFSLKDIITLQEIFFTKSKVHPPLAFQPISCLSSFVPGQVHEKSEKQRPIKYIYKQI